MEPRQDESLTPRQGYRLCGEGAMLSQFIYMRVALIFQMRQTTYALQTVTEYRNIPRSETTGDFLMLMLLEIYPSLLSLTTTNW